MSSTTSQVFVPNPTTIRAESTKLSIDPKGSKVVYCQGRSVIIRNLDDPSDTLVYSQHAQPVQVARISPSGYYCASADASGKVRVWDLVGEEQISKSEFQVLGGKVKDLKWDGESKRIIAVGEGKEKYGHAFLMDSGSSVGEISGHSKPINAVAMRSQRPFRAATASDDSSIAFFHGAPYKYQKSISTHTKFVQDVSYTPSGSVFASAGSDGKVFLYDGTSGDTLVELSASAGSDSHKGTIFAIDFSPDSKSLITVGADGTAKLWDVEQKKLAGTWELTGLNGSGTGDKVDDQQVGVTFAGNGRAVSLSFCGDLNVLDLSSPGKIQEKLFGPTKSIGVGSLVRAPDAKSLIAGSFDGRVVSFTLDGRCSEIIKPSSSSAVTALASAGNAFFSASMDGSIKKIDGTKVSTHSTTSSQPKSMSCSSSGAVFVANVTGVDVISSSGKHFTPIASSPQSIASNADGSVIAVGLENSKVQLFSSDGKSLTASGELSNGRSSITALGFSPDGSLLAAGESNGKILVYDVQGKSLKLSHWVFHSGRVNAIQFSPDGTHAISGSLDTNAYIWSVAKPTKNIAIKNCHANGVNGVCWLDDSSAVTAGADGCVKIHSIKRHT